MTASAYDAVIAGGGLSGLSLAAHLATHGWHDRAVLVVDDRTAGVPATRWGSWSAGPRLLDPAVHRTYRQVRISAAGRTRVVALGPYRYELLRRTDVRRVTLDLVRACPRFAVLDGHVDTVHDGVDAAEVVVDGRPIGATWVFDSVTARPPGNPADARLAFAGYDLRCDRPVFDLDTPVLFDFRIPQDGDGARFVYVLPEDPYHALVELTEFLPRHARPPTAASMCDALGTYLPGMLRGTGYEIVRTESAVLPLRVRPDDRRHGRILALGGRGGLIKASTGYGYTRIQRDSRAIATSLTRHGDPFHLPAPSWRYRLLDALLLDVLDRDPGQLELAFAGLFLDNPAPRVLRFLDEDSSTVDLVRLMGSLPPTPYLRALARRVAAPAN